jgi:hypothetical protein
MSADVRRFPATCRLLRAIGEALFYRGAPLPPGQLDWVEREAMTTLILSGRRARLLFSLALFAVGWLAPLWIWRLPPLSRLPLSQRIAALSRFEDSRLGAPLLLGLKAVLCFLFYEQPEPLAALGRPPGCMLAVPPSLRALPIMAAASATSPTEAA